MFLQVVFQDNGHAVLELKEASGVGFTILTFVLLSLLAEFPWVSLI
jgi:hypothetical protein